MLPQHAVWYIDGSALEADIPQVMAVGFAAVLVDANDGQLLAFAYGVPPSWVNSSAAAEGWALYAVLATILQIANLIGRVRYAGIVTDCKSLLFEIARGKAKCIHHTRVMARLWRLIFRVLDSEETAPPELLDALVRMPAHKTLANVSLHIKSNGTHMTALDWRANRLADGGAKFAAEGGRLSPYMRRASMDELAALELAFVRLGYVTLAANSHVQWTVPDGGTVPIKTVRRDTDVNTLTRRSRKRLVEQAKCGAAPTRKRIRASHSVPAVGHTAIRHGTKRASSSNTAAVHRDRCKVDQADAEARWRARLSEQLVSRSTTPDNWRTVFNERVLSRIAFRERLAERMAKGLFG